MKRILSLILLTSISALHAAELMTITCDFYAYSEPNEKGKAEDGFKGMRFVFEPGKSQGVMLGNAGESQVMIVSTDDSITFIQIDPIVTTTTIELKTMKAVHSRNTVLMGELLPSQYYGKAVSVR